jgi:hypothetical protein
MGRVRSTNGVKRNEYRALVGKQIGKKRYEEQELVGLIILKWILVR